MSNLTQVSTSYRTNETLINARSGRRPYHGHLYNEDVIPSDQVLQLAGLDWDVKEAPLSARFECPTSGIDTLESVPGKALFGQVSGEQRYFGSVSDNYKVIQNAQLVEFMSGLVDEEGAKYIGAGQMGAVVWLMAKMPKSFEPVKGDKTELFLMVVNGHNGKQSFEALLTPNRIVCNNMFRRALSNRRKSYKIRHTANAMSLVKEARQALSGSVKSFDMFEELAKGFVKLQMTGDRMDRFKNAILPLPKPDEDGIISHVRLANVNKERAKIESLFAHGVGQDIKGVAGTGWAAFNAVTEHANYSLGRSDEKRFQQLVLGGKGEKLVDSAISWLADEAFA